MKLASKLALALVGAAASMTALADPTGTWRTIDDKTGQPRSIVKISVEGGKYVGRVQQILNAPSNICTTCTGKYENKDLSGVAVFWGVSSEGGNKYGGGQIIDPKNGSTYSVSLTDNGSTLVVRGYKGVSMLGRNQTWQRQ
jgi:uncharacterized protein (DUF2147 family)